MSKPKDWTKLKAKWRDSDVRAYDPISSFIPPSEWNNLNSKNPKVKRWQKAKGLRK